MSVRRTGGVAINGQKVGKPSPVGQWRSQVSVDFDRDEFTAVLYDKGYKVLWEKATLCPNRPATGLAPRDHDIDCRICDGTGFLFFSSRETRMLVTGVRIDQMYYAFGRWDAGQIMVTALPEERVHYWDRLTLLNGVSRFHELVRRQPGTQSDKLKYTPLCLEHVSRIDRVGALQTYSINEECQARLGNLEWLTTSGLPDDGAYYSVAYTYRPRYVVLDLMHQHRESTIEGLHYEFPTQAVAKLDFLIRDESRDSPEVDDANPFPR